MCDVYRESNGSAGARSIAAMVTNGIVWGNTTLNSIPGIGTGSVTNYTVYATAPNANNTPGDYAYTVTIDVTYGIGG